MSFFFETPLFWSWETKLLLPQKLPSLIQDFHNNNKVKNVSWHLVAFGKDLKLSVNIAVSSDKIASIVGLQVSLGV